MVIEGVSQRAGKITVMHTRRPRGSSGPAHLALTAALLCASPAWAATSTPRGVVELFTSQGCSSCPPADRLLSTLAKDPGLITLSFPVDYWDYIGWKDTLADPAFTARQKSYGERRGDGQIYTPQAVVDGIAQVVGSDREDILGAVATSAQRRGAMSVPVTLAMKGANVAIDVGAGGPGAAAKAVVWLVDVIPEKTVAIGRGENRGNSVTYTNVVRKLSRLGDWTGQPAHFEIAPRLGEAGYVVLLQASDPGPGVILGAAKGP